MNINVDPSTLEDVICAECGSNHFKDVVVIKRISAILSPSGKEGIISVPEFVCASCGYGLKYTMERESDALIQF